jgi:hypothetical protein
MKALIVCFAIWIFVVPAAVAVLLVSTFIVVLSPDLYFSFIALALGLSITAMASGTSWLEPFFTASVRLFPNTLQLPNSIQEIKHEKTLEGQIDS